MKANGQLITLSWIPGHVGIRGNEEADRHAKHAAQGISSLICSPYTDYVTAANVEAGERWNNAWKQLGNKMVAVRDRCGPWKKVQLDRVKQVKLNRLRVGHTDITHNCLMDTTIQRGPLPCPACNNATLSVNILAECQSIRAVRRTHFGEEEPDMKNSLEMEKCMETYFSFLKHCGVYEAI